jgi:hypothetical protein
MPAEAISSPEEGIVGHPRDLLIDLGLGDLAKPPHDPNYLVAPKGA